MIVEAGKERYPDIDKFVQEHPNGNVFHCTSLVQLYKNTEPYSAKIFTSLNGQGQINGVLAVYILKEKGLKSIFSKRGIVWGGPLAQDNDESVKAALLKFWRSRTGLSLAYLQVRNLYDMPNQKVYRDNGFNFEEHLDIIFDLKKTEEQLWKEASSTRRKQIKRSRNRGVSIELVSGYKNAIVENCYKILEETYNKVGLPFPSISFFHNAYKYLEEQGILKTFVAKYEEQIIGFRMVLCYKDLVYDWYAGADSAFLDKYPNDLLPWEIIIWSKNNGFEYFDFGGAGKPGIPYGVRDYKLKFGGSLVNYGRFESINNPVLMGVGKLGFKILKKLKSRK